MNTLLKIDANWPAPSNIKAITTTRRSGHSKAPYDSNNLALHVGDHESNVLKNRLQIKETFYLPSEPQWLNQTHSTRCVNVDEDQCREADASVTRNPHQVLAIMTADCLPILLCNQEGTEIAAIHAGWRGLVNGIIEQTLRSLKSKPQELLAWIGPSICQACYETGDEVRAHYQKNYPQHQDNLHHQFFTPSPNSTPQQLKWFTNLPGLAEEILHQLQVDAVYQSKQCTFEKQDDFYSYRRAAQTGRIASLIWFTS